MYSINYYYFKDKCTGRLSSYCKLCKSKKAETYRLKNREQIKKAKQEYYKANRTTILKDRKLYYCNNKDKIDSIHKEWRIINKDKSRSYGRKLVTGWSYDFIKQAEEYQDKKCFICGLDLKGKERNLHADHDHITGDIRALLCPRCNMTLGSVKENLDTLWKMIKYIIYFKINGKGTEYIKNANLDDLCFPTLDEIISPILGDNWMNLLDKKEADKS